MIKCSNCKVDLIKNHILKSTFVPKLKNGSEVIEPSCSKCKKIIDVSEVESNINSNQKVLLISGTAGAGRSTIGQELEKTFPFVLIDGDAINHKIFYRAKFDPEIKQGEYLCHTEVIRSMLITLGLGYNVIIAYVIESKDLIRYERELTKQNVDYILRILTPSRDACLSRDKERTCWTGGAVFVDKWFEEFQDMKRNRKEICIDNTYETVVETVNRHFKSLF